MHWQIAMLPEPPVLSLEGMLDKSVRADDRH